MNKCKETNLLSTLTSPLGNVLAGSTARLQGLRRRDVLVVLTTGSSPLGSRARGRSPERRSAPLGGGGRGATSRGGLGSLSLAPAGTAAGKGQTGRSSSFCPLGRGSNDTGSLSNGLGGSSGGGSGGLASGLGGFALSPAGAVASEGNAGRSSSLGALRSRGGSVGRRSSSKLLLLGLAPGHGLLLALLLAGSNLAQLLALLLLLLLEALELLPASLQTLPLFLLLPGGALLGLAELTLTLLTLALLTDPLLAGLLAAGVDLLLHLTLGITAALLELITATLVQVRPERLVEGHEASKTVLELNISLVLKLSLLESLGLGTLVGSEIALALLGVVFGELLSLLLPEGTLEMVKTLAGDTELLGDAVLLTLELLELDHADLAAVKGLDILTLELLELHVLEQSLNLLPLDLLTLVGKTLGLAELLLLSKTSGLSLLEGLLLEKLLAGILLLLLGMSLRSLVLALLNDLLASKYLLVLLLGTSLGASKGLIASLDASLVEARVDVAAGGVEGLSKASELRAHNLGGSALETLDRASLALGRASRRTSVDGLGGREDVGVEAKDASGVVHADGKIALLVAVHDELLNGAAGDLERLGELSQALDELEVDSLIHLRKLLEQAGENDLLKRKDVLLHLGIGANLGKNGGDLLANGKRVEVDLEDVVEIANLGLGAAEERLGKSIAEETSTGRGLGHAEQVGQARVLVLAGLIEVDHGTAGARGADDGDGEGGENNESGSPLEVSIAASRVISLLAVAGSNESSRLAQEVVIAGPSSGVEKVVLADEEDTGKLLVVVGYYDVLGGALAEAEEGVDILNTAKSLLPELELNGDVELLEAGLKVTLQSIGVVQVNSVHLSRVLGGGLDMVAEKLAKAAELGLADVLEAEVEGLHGGALVEDLKTSIVPENIQNSAVGLPKELKPRGDDSAVGTVARLLTGNGSEQDGLGGLGGLEIVDVGGGGLDAGLDLVGLGLGNGDLLGGELDELLEDQLDGGDVGVLGDVLVLVEGVLGKLALLLLDGELDEEEHHGLQGGDGDIAGALRGDVLVEQGQGGGGLVDPDELVGALENILRLLVGWGRLLMVSDGHRGS